MFADPEDPNKGILISCVTGWNCAEVIRIKTYAYGLDETYNLSEPGSSGALDAGIAGPYKKGEACSFLLLGTYLAAWDLRYGAAGRAGIQR